MKQYMYRLFVTREALKELRKKFTADASLSQNFDKT